VLLGRRPVPPAAQWQNALEASDTPARVKQQLRKLIAIESLGAEVVAVEGDVCRRDDLQRVLAMTIARFGSINGVIHAAGVVEDGPLQVKSRLSAARVLEPKVKGTLVLADVLEEVLAAAKPAGQLDFCALFSSVSSVQAPAGQVDYAAANSFLDTYA